MKRTNCGTMNLAIVAAVGAVSLLAGCATNPRVLSTVSAGEPSGYAEFYVVPTYAESVVFKDAFEVLVAHVERGKTNLLEKTTGNIFAGDRLRVACVPGKHEFCLKPAAIGRGANNQGEHGWMRVVADVRENMVTPVRATIRVTETDANAMKNASKGLLGGAMGGIAYGVGAGLAGGMKGCVYEMRLDSGSPQPYYAKLVTSSWYGYRYGSAFIEACDEAKAKTMKEKLDRIAPGLDLKRESDRAEFLKRYGIAPNGANPNGCVVRIATKDSMTTWMSLAFGE